MTDPVVEVRQPGRRPLSVVLDGPLDLGRECDGVLLADPGVSRRHARLEVDDGDVRIRDLGSTNGTLVNGRRITVPTPLGPGDQALIGGTEITVVVPEPEVAPATGARMTVAGAAALARALAPEAAADPRQTSIAQVAAQVEGVQRTAPPLAPDGGDGDTITIVFSDIESSTEHALRLGDGRWYDLLGIHNSIVRNNVLRHGGTEIKAQGDGFMLTFTSARRALNFAMDVQRALSRWSAEHPEEAVRVRIGMHTGEALVSAEGDLFGKHVIVAARIANLADGGEVLASSVTVEIASNRGDLEWDEGRAVELKGIEGTYLVHALRWG